MTIRMTEQVLSNRCAEWESLCLDDQFLSVTAVLLGLFPSKLYTMTAL